MIASFAKQLLKPTRFVSCAVNRQIRAALSAPLHTNRSAMSEFRFMVMTCVSHPQSDLDAAWRS
eukprot:127460-Hanusia_phi.AAC.2